MTRIQTQRFALCTMFIVLFVMIIVGAMPSVMANPNANAYSAYAMVDPTLTVIPANFPTQQPHQAHIGVNPSASCANTGSTYINYPDFTNTSNLCLVDSAFATQTTQDGNVVRLTNNGAQDGELWNLAQEDVSSFYTTFSFRLTQVPSYSAGDGITFAIQNSSVSAFGAQGGGIGYENIPDSLVIEFDTFANTGSPVFDPNADHMAIQSCGTAPNSRNHQLPPNGCLVALFPNLVSPSGNAITMTDGNIHHVAISYSEASKVLVVSLDGYQASAPFDLISSLNLSNNKAWVGFTAATFTAAENADILNWTFASGGNVRTNSVSLYDPSADVVYMANPNPAIGIDYKFVYGSANDIPLLGDWTGTNMDTIGVWRPSNQTFYLRNTNTTGFSDISFQFGNPNDVPLVGQWSATAGHDGVGVFRSSSGVVYLKNALAAGSADYSTTLGLPGDQPVAGDWNGDGVDGIGVYRLSSGTGAGISPNATTGTFYLDDYPCIASCSTETLSLNISGLSSNSHPIAGDWSYLGRSAVGVYDSTSGMLYQRNELTNGSSDTVATLLTNNPGFVPIAGDPKTLKGYCTVSLINNTKFRFQPEMWPANYDYGYLFTLGINGIITLNQNGGSWLWPSDRTALPPNGTTYGMISVNGALGVVPWDSAVQYQWYQVTVSGGQLGQPVVGYIALSPTQPLFSLNNCPGTLPPPQVYPPDVSQIQYAPMTYAVPTVVSMFGTNLPPANVGSLGFHDSHDVSGAGSYFDVAPRNIEFCIDSYNASNPQICDPIANLSLTSTPSGTPPTPGPTATLVRVPVFVPVSGCGYLDTSGSFPIFVIDLDCGVNGNTPVPMNMAHRYMSLSHLSTPISANGSVVSAGQFIGYLCLSNSSEFTSCGLTSENVHIAFNLYQRVPGNTAITQIPANLIPQEILGILAQPSCSYNDFLSSSSNPIRQYTPTLVACPPGVQK